MNTAALVERVAARPVVLSTRASLELGYEPVGTYAGTIPRQIEWLVNTAASGAVPVANDPFFRHFIDYRLEDWHLDSN